MASAVISLVLAVALAVPPTQGTSFYDLPAQHTIQQVQVVTRNGLSAPDKVFTDDYGNETQLWQHGPGQLLDEGLRQHDNLGRWLRRRYGAILDAFPNASQIWAVSKPSDNMIESALANLAAIFFRSRSPYLCPP
ncbi:testicular acid phosphatase-like [Hyalella azteca]|uniref:acid phosphatase n=1 Tax=Hyalella azteca TaxID=294128 RepID=A0A8B7NMK8_HYAAZ|nr:testicular acid phosphatase-like [Hyalella azteca]